MLNLIRDLYADWADALWETRVEEPDDPTRHGALFCPCCGIIHGRCQETMTAFLERARETGDPRYITAAEEVFAWADRNLSLPDGSFRNDTDVDWLCTTVFNVIQILDALRDYEDLLSPATYAYWKRRTAAAADFLAETEKIEAAVINYPIGNAYAMWRCAEFFGEERYRERSRYFRNFILDYISVSDLLFGEGNEKGRTTPKGGKCIDIGYNLEESIPLLTRLAIESADRELIALCRRLTLSHSDFVLDNGILDDSFGSRNYKWTLWGSRTSDGLHLPFLVFATPDNRLAEKAAANLELLKACTHEGYLYSGPHHHAVGELPCLHHAITHVKALVSLLYPPYDEPLKAADELCKRPQRFTAEPPALAVRFFPELDTYRIYHGPYTSTLTAYDWHYVYGGHISGGSLSLLNHRDYGPLTASSMSSYHRQEFNNMQDPLYPNHANLSPRLEWTVSDSETGSAVVYSSAYDHEAELRQLDGESFAASGHYKDPDGNMPPGSAAEYAYEFHYAFNENGVTIRIRFAKGRLLLPLVADPAAAIEETAQRIRIRGERADLTAVLKTGTFRSNEHRRIYNHVPGLAAYETHVLPEDGTIVLHLGVSEHGKGEER